ncbi:integrase [Advenella sp. S44]|uniref:tyrosine-type recombinase/integrase n=1 Tax=Advenella sp. S44 TaxID=1982755 RepID=UPI000C2ACCED|nr:integrase family protein [Advenella sp. S44]PJX23350.1 integrase [Advenella sp. S44]
MGTLKALTKQAIEALPVPASGQQFYWYADPKGLAVRVTTNGSKSFIVQGRVNGKTCRYTIGPCNLLDAREAQKRARNRLSEMYDGLNPQVERKRRQAQGITLQEVMKDYIENKRTKHGPLRPSSKADIIKCVTKTLSDWADKPVANITRDACVKRFRLLSATAPITANQTFRNLRALCNWARESNVAADGSYPILPINPVVQAFKSVQWNKEESKEEFIPLNKIGKVWELLSERTNTERYIPADNAAAHLVMFLILTGARIGEGSALRWSEVHLDSELPYFVLTETKNHNVVTIPMSTQLKALLDARLACRGKNDEYVFPSRAGSKVPHMQDARGTMRQVSEIAGMHLHNHDLRRTFIAICLECKIELWKAEILTNHLPATVTLKHYTQTRDLRYLLPEVQNVADWISAQAKEEIKS